MKKHQSGFAHRHIYIPVVLGFRPTMAWNWLQKVLNMGPWLLCDWWPQWWQHHKCCFIFQCTKHKQFFFLFQKQKVTASRACHCCLLRIEEVCSMSPAALHLYLLHCWLLFLCHIYSWSTVKMRQKMTAVCSVDTFDLTAWVEKQFQELESIVANFYKQ